MNAKEIEILEFICKFREMGGKMEELPSKWKEEYDKISLFPKKTTIYLHSDKDSMWKKGEEIGLSQEAIRNHFRGCLYEVGIEIKVYEDGTYKILGVSE